MDASEILAELRRLNPGVRYARTENGSAVGEWVDGKGRFVPLYERVLTGQWCRTYVPGGMITEILADGKPVERAWVE